MLPYRYPSTNDDRYVQRLATEWPGAGLACLPNYAFSLPLARWQRSQQRAARLRAALARAGAAGSNGSDGSGRRREDEEEEENGAACEALVQAVMLHPLAVVRLMQRCAPTPGRHPHTPCPFVVSLCRPG